MIVKRRRLAIIATNTKDLADIVSIARKMEKERLVRWVASEAACYLPVKTLADATGCSTATFDRTMQHIIDSISELNRDLK